MPVSPLPVAKNPSTDAKKPIPVAKNPHYWFTVAKNLPSRRKKNLWTVAINPLEFPVAKKNLLPSQKTRSPIRTYIFTLHWVTVHYITVQYSTLHTQDLVHKIVCHRKGISPKSSEHTLHYITVQYSTAQYSTVRYSSVRYGTLHYTTLRYITWHYITLHTEDLVHKIVCHQRGKSPKSSESTLH